MRYREAQQLRQLAVVVFLSLVVAAMVLWSIGCPSDRLRTGF